MTSPPGIPSPTEPAVAAAVAAWAAVDDDDAAVLAAVVNRVAGALGVDAALRIDGRGIAPSLPASAVEVADGVLRRAGPWLPGFVRAARTDRHDRRRGGVHHTAPEVCDVVVGRLLAHRRFRRDDVVLDPAVGGGAFLLAAARRMPGTRAERVARLRGIDIDPLAVAVTRAALELWADTEIADDAVVVGDALELDPWPAAHVVLGNPPFQSQVRGATVRGRRRLEQLKRRWPDVAGYVDTAGVFLLAASAQAEAVGLVIPASLLAGRDAAPVRRRALERLAPVDLWIDDARRFDADVDAVALVLTARAPEAGVDGPRPVVRRHRGVPAEPLPAVRPPTDDSWAPLLAVHPGLPARLERPARRLGDVAEVAAGFRDQFYGLRPAVGDDPDGPHRLVTCGLIDPLDLRWGRVPCRFDRRRWTHPVIDPENVAPTVRRWVADRLRPKLLVASQTRVLECVVDHAGTLVPCTPVLSVEPRPGAPSLDHLAVVLTSPVAAALALRRQAGTALSAEAVRVTSTLLADLPLPADTDAWDEAATAVAAVRETGAGTGELARVGELALRAYGLAHRGDLLRWWRERLPRR